MMEVVSWLLQYAASGFLLILALFSPFRYRKTLKGRTVKIIYIRPLCYAIRRRKIWLRYYSIAYGPKGKIVSCISFQSN